MTRAALALALLALPAHAGDTAPLSDTLVEPRYRLTVIEEAVIGPLWVQDDARSWAILAAWAAGPDALAPEPPVAPVPLPPTILPLAMGIMALLIWKGLRQ